MSQSRSHLKPDEPWSLYDEVYGDGRWARLPDVPPTEDDLLKDWTINAVEASRTELVQRWREIIKQAGFFFQSKYTPLERAYGDYVICRPPDIEPLSSQQLEAVFRRHVTEKDCAGLAVQWVKYMGFGDTRVDPDIYYVLRVFWPGNDPARWLYSEPWPLLHCSISGCFRLEKHDC